MKNLYLIVGHNNVLNFEENDYGSIDINSIHHKTFDNQKEKDIFISALYLIDTNMRGLIGNYTIITEAEYNRLIE